MAAWLLVSVVAIKTSVKTSAVCCVSDDKPVQEEDWVVCQHPECPDRRRASKVRRGSPKVNLTVLQS